MSTTRILKRYGGEVAKPLSGRAFTSSREWGIWGYAKAHAYDTCATKGEPVMAAVINLARHPEITLCEKCGPNLL